MKATAQDRVRLEQETARLVEQLKAMGAKKIVLFGSLARSGCEGFTVGVFAGVSAWIRRRRVSLVSFSRTAGGGVGTARILGAIRGAVRSEDSPGTGTVPRPPTSRLVRPAD